MVVALEKLVPKVLASHRGVVRVVETRWRRYTKRLPLAPDTFVRASSIPDLCPREEVLRHRLQCVTEEVLDVNTLITFAHGTCLS